MAANFRETLGGRIVLSFGCDAKTDAELGITDEVKGASMCSTCARSTPPTRC